MLCLFGFCLTLICEYCSTNYRLNKAFNVGDDQVLNMLSMLTCFVFALAVPWFPLKMFYLLTFFV